MRFLKGLSRRAGSISTPLWDRGRTPCSSAVWQGKEGQVWAFDIQGKALELTRELLEREGMDKRARLILCGHEHMDRYLEPERVDGICFNFGYLPGGDHRIATRPETSVAAG